MRLMTGVIYCNWIMDSTNFRDFIKESDNDKNSNQHAVVEYHGWHLLPDAAERKVIMKM
jgi:hypothetical protein